jgi:hypothetical protein
MSRNMPRHFALPRVPAPPGFEARDHRIAEDFCMNTERHTVWTPAEETVLVTGIRAGLTPERMADALRKTPGSVRWKLNALGLQGGNPQATGATSQTVTWEDYRARQGDLAFKRAMLKAIASGAENAVPCVVRAKPGAHYIPCVPAPSDSGYRSSAALAAELGEAPESA